MQHGSLRAPVRVFMAAVLLCLTFLAAPKAAAAQLQDVNGITLLSFDSQQIVSIGNQTSGRCSWYALRYARTILDGKPCSGSGMWSNGAVWSAAGYYAYSGSLSDCLSRLYEELQAGRPVIVHLKNTAVSGVSKHTNRVTSYEYHLSGSGWKEVNSPPHRHQQHLRTLGVRSGHLPHGRPRKPAGERFLRAGPRAGQRERHTGRNKAFGWHHLD